MPVLPAVERKDAILGTTKTFSPAFFIDSLQNILNSLGANNDVRDPLHVLPTAHLSAAVGWAEARTGRPYTAPPLVEE